MIKFQRAWAMPNKRTFKIKPIEDWITRCMIDEIGINWVPQCLRSYMSVFKGANTKTGWIDPFAGDCEVEGGPFFCRETNDLNPKNGAQFCLPAIKYLRGKESASVDGVFFDPPYSPRQNAMKVSDVRSRSRTPSQSSGVTAKRRLPVWSSLVDMSSALVGTVVASDLVSALKSNLYFWSLMVGGTTTQSVFYNKKLAMFHKVCNIG